MIKDDNNNIIGYKAILHFLVPAVYVDTSAIGEDSKGPGINQLCLYSTKEVNEENCSAYFLFTNKEIDDAGNEIVV